MVYIFLRRLSNVIFLLLIYEIKLSKNTNRTNILFKKLSKISRDLSKEKVRWNQASKKRLWTKLESMINKS